MACRFLLSVTLILAFSNIFGQHFTRQDADSMIRVLNKSKNPIEHIYLLLNLAQFHIFKTGYNQIDIDSAVNYINEAKILNNSVKSSTALGFQCLTESYLIKEQGQHAAAQRMVEQAISIFKIGSNKSYLGRAFLDLSMYYDYVEPKILSKRIDLVTQAISVFQEAGNLQMKAYSLKMLGDLYIIANDFHKSIQVLNQALAVYDTINYKSTQGVYLQIGEAYRYKKDYAHALFYALSALKTAHSVHDTSMQLCQINNILGSLYLEIDQKEIAINYLKDALKTALYHRDDYYIYFLNKSIADTYNKLDQPNNALRVLYNLPERYLTTKNPFDKASVCISYLRSYIKLKLNNKAQPYCGTLLELILNDKVSNQVKIDIYQNVANYYFHAKQFTKARHYLMQSSDIVKNLSYVNGDIELASLWYKLDSAQGNYQSAFTHLLHYHSKADSFFHESKKRQIQVLGVEYEMKIKDKDIELITQKNNLQQAYRKQSMLSKNAMIVGIILAFSFTVLIYQQYRRKQKSKLLVNQNNE